MSAHRIGRRRTGRRRIGRRRIGRHRGWRPFQTKFAFLSPPPLPPPPRCQLDLQFTLSPKSLFPDSNEICRFCFLSRKTNPTAKMFSSIRQHGRMLRNPRKIGRGELFWTNKQTCFGKSYILGIASFVIQTKSFINLGITKISCYNSKVSCINNSCLVLSTKRFVAAAKFLVAATKNLFVVPNFVAVTKPFFRV